MNDPAIRRWNPGFVAMRWRHVFWIVPLLGVLAALTVHLAFFHRTDIRAVVAVRGVNFDLKELLHSDVVMRKSVRDLGLAARWSMDEDSAMERLRGETVMTVVPGTALAGISHLDFHPGKATEAAMTVVRHLVDETENRLRHSFIDLRINELSQAACMLDAEHGELLQRIELERIKSERASRDPALLAADIDPELVAALDRNRRLLEQVNLQLISVKYAQITYESPLLGLDSPSFSQTLLPASKRLGIGLFAAVLAAPLVAYLLELLFPRKPRPEEIPDPVAPCHLDF